MTFELIKLARKWNNSQTEYNRIQFLDEFNRLNVDKQIVAVQKRSDLSKTLIGWSAVTRIEIVEEQKI